MNYPSYPNTMRAVAKRSGQFLVTVDVIRPSGRREFCSQGPLTKAQAKPILRAALKAIIARAKAAGDGAGSPKLKSARRRKVVA